jgi:GNAT superfamily N-acetyltransferase
MGGILTLGRVQVDQIGALLAAAFHDEPVSRWLQPDPATRVETGPGTLAGLFAGFTAEAMVTGTVDLLFDRDYDHGPVATALWFDRTIPAAPNDVDTQSDGQRDGAVSAGDGAGVGVFDERTGGRWGQFERALSRPSPGAGHAYLMVMGVHPDHQGRGLGTRLLRRRLAVLDADRTPAYLEATGPASRALYARHGYRDHGQPLHLPDGGPCVWPMWRAVPHPQRPQRSQDKSGRGCVIGGREGGGDGRL